MSVRASPESRRAYKAFRGITTRWMDNDVYGHVNNVVYYSYFDTAVNEYLIEAGYLNPSESPIIGFVVETRCCYFSPIAFPDRVTAGIRVANSGISSVRYEIGLFRNDDELASAQGHLIHVYVNRLSKRPVPLPDDLRRVLAPIMASAMSSFAAEPKIASDGNNGRAQDRGGAGESLAVLEAARGPDGLDVGQQLPGEALGLGVHDDRDHQGRPNQAEI